MVEDHLPDVSFGGVRRQPVNVDCVRGCSGKKKKVKEEANNEWTKSKRRRISDLLTRLSDLLCFMVIGHRVRRDRRLYYYYPA